MTGTPFQRSPSRSRGRNVGSKVPEVTITFWIIKVLITGANVWVPDRLSRGRSVADVAGMPVGRPGCRGECHGDAEQQRAEQQPSWSAEADDEADGEDWSDRVVDA